MFEDPSTSGLLAAALAYARAGLAVLPLHTPALGGGCSCRRGSCDRAGKHPRLPHGLTEADTDPDRLRSWWARWPGANIGLRTGGLADVCDIDSDAGRAALLALLGPDAPRGPLVRTGSGGWHVYLAATGYGNRARLLPGVDWRGAGGYVVAPPSRHASGGRYRWVQPLRTGLPECPAALLRLLAPVRPPPDLAGSAAAAAAPEGGSAPVRWPAPGPLRHPDRYARTVLDRECARVAGAVVGERNHTLYRAARSLARLADAGLIDPGQVSAALADAAGSAGLGRAEADRTIRSALTGPRYPRPGPYPDVHPGPG